MGIRAFVFPVAVALIFTNARLEAHFIEVCLREQGRGCWDEVLISLN